MRIIWVVSAPDNLSWDEPTFDELAHNLLVMRRLAFSHGAYMTAVPNEPTSFEEPLYPLCLATVYLLFGDGNYLMARIISALLSAVTGVIFYWIALQLFGRSAALVAGCFIAVYPPLVYFTGLLMSETLFIFLESLVIALAYLSVRGPSVKINVALGITFALACLTRSVLLGFLPVFLAWMWSAILDKENVRKTIAITGISALLTIAPWTLRNFLVHREFG